MEKQKDGRSCHEVLDSQTVQLTQIAGGSGGDEALSGAGAAGGSGPFTFDRVFDTDATQSEVYQHVAGDLVKQCLDGYYCTCFAYGQTGAGKTHSMMGSRTDEEQAGIIPRIVADIFNRIGAADGNEEFTVRVSYVEIYLERIRDLLATGSGTTSGGFDSQNLKIRHDKKGRGLFIEGVSEFYLSGAEEMLRLVLRGDAARATASTNMNATSSRSHSIFIISVGQKNVVSGASKEGKLFVCDLAGSEMVKKTAAAGTTLREAQQINKSLSALGNVIKALTEESAHVPYRDSALTRLLSEALGGNSKTSLLVVSE
jgi:kinesin family protein 5